MRIVYVESFTKVHHEQPKVKALQELGHEVIAVEERSVDSIHRVLNFKPDILLYTKLKTLNFTRYELVDEAKRRGIITVCWIPDLYWGMTRQKNILGNDPIFRSDIVLTPDGGNDERWSEHGVNHHLLRQGFDKEFYYRGGESDCPEIVFVGSTNQEWPYREKLCRFLKTTYGNRFRWYGRHDSEEIRGRHLNSLYNSAKIVIGDSVYAPNYWSNRIYETLGRGGFLIHPDVPGLSEEYEPYKEFIPYNFDDFKGLWEKIDYFLDHPEEREKIREAGFQRTKNYLMIERCRKLMSLIQG